MRLVPFGKARMVLEAAEGARERGETALVITYGMGVYWALEAAKSLEGRVSVLDLRTLSPWDKAEVMKQARMHGRVLVLTEEPSSPSFAQSVQGAIQEECFEALDAPVKLLGAENMPAIPLNSTLEKTMLPNELKVNELLTQLLTY